MSPRRSFPRRHEGPRTGLGFHCRWPLRSLRLPSRRLRTQGYPPSAVFSDEPSLTTPAEGEAADSGCRYHTAGSREAKSLRLVRKSVEPDFGAAIVFRLVHSEA